MVNFVGAGPGAVDLITVRGMKLIAEADVVIYAGSLVNPEILSYKKDNALVYNSAHMTLEEVIEIINMAEKNKQNTVRLHTGDPAFYGAIREQMDILEELGIEYKICPGVSSMSGAAASLNAEYTLPGISQTVILSRMEGRTSVPASMSIEKLAGHKATMVIFLSTGLLKELTESLLKGGCSPKTKAAIVYKATWHDEKIIRCTVDTLEQSAKENNITKTALILVGEFLGNTYNRSELYNPNFSTEFREANI
jgi:precorrin-4 C11-methyltransferase